MTESKPDSCTPHPPCCPQGCPQPYPPAAPVDKDCRVYHRLTPVENPWTTPMDSQRIQPGRGPRLGFIDIFFLFFLENGLTAAPAGKTIMGSVQTFGGQSKAGANRPAKPPWSSDEPPSVSPPRIRRRAAAAAHDRTQVLRSPAKWHTLCPPHSLFFILGAVNPADDYRLLVGEGIHLSPERLSAVARPHRRYVRNAPQPSDLFQISATGAALKQDFCIFNSQKGYASHRPPAPFFQKGVAARL